MQLLRSFLCVLVCSLSAVLMQGACVADSSVRVIESPSKVVITANGDGSTRVEIIVDDSGLQPMTPMSPDPRSGRRGKLLFFNNVFGGVVVPVDKPAGMLTSWEVGVANLIGYGLRTGKGAPILSVGAGFACRWYNVGDGYGLMRLNDRLNLQPLDAEQDGFHDPASQFCTASALLTFSLKQKLGRRWIMDLSAILDFNVYTDAFFSYNDGSEKAVRTKVHYEGLNQRVMRCDLMATVGLAGIAGIYVRYSPSAVFHRGYGPHFQQIAAGLSFIL